MSSSLLTPQKVADMFKVPLASTRYWRHRGTGPTSIKVGRHVRYRREDVESWLDSLTDGAPSA